MIGMTVAKVAEHTGGTLCGGGGERPVTGAVRAGRVYGTQFHPEKSGDTGLRILKAFAEL